MNKELQININLEDGSYVAKYNPDKMQNQKAIECLKEVKEWISKNIMFDTEGVVILAYIDTKIKELERKNLII